MALYVSVIFSIFFWNKILFVIFMTFFWMWVFGWFDSRNTQYTITTNSYTATSTPLIYDCYPNPTSTNPYDCTLRK